MINNSCVILARPNTGDYYEGDGNSLRAISPRPIVSPAQFLWDTNLQPIVFREDSYDPTTRVRRGRFYRQTDGTSYMLEKVQYRPYLPLLVTSATGVIFVDKAGLSITEKPAREHRPVKIRLARGHVPAPRHPEQYPALRPQSTGGTPIVQIVRHLLPRDTSAPLQPS